MGYHELKSAVLALHRIAFADPTVGVGPTWATIEHLVTELRGADVSAAVETESGPVDLAGELLAARDPLFDLWNSLPEGYTLTVAHNVID